ncbi:MAG: LPXTG cell wall anchor domain-containing protein, partial [Streptococcus sp.]|nr:LPXTG cell wall anchor domain-containing protein [Streptococcus sp.]
IPQTGTVVFTPSGKQRYSLTDDAVIDEAIEPVIVDETGAKVTLDAEGYYVVAGEGKYKVTGAGKDVTVEFIPEAGFVGTGKGITIRRTDDNGNDTGWTPVSANETIVSDQTNTMDGRYIPTVVPMSKELTSTKVQGLVHVETPKFEGKGGDVTPSSEKPMLLVDPKTGKALGASASAMKDGKEVGTYTVDETTGKVTFTPNKDFTGTAETIVLQVIEKATGKAIAGLKYTPTVTPVTPTGEDVTSTGKQGKVQTGIPKFTEGDVEVPLKVDSDQPAKFVVNGTAVDDTTIDATKDGAKVGTYTLDSLTGEVTFTPNKDFVGTPDAVTVQVKDENGKAATGKYTPTVTAVTPTGEDATSTDVQGKTQTAKPTFIEGDAEVPLDDSVPATFEDGTTEKVIAGVGTFTVAADGTITFVPEASFTGETPAVTIQRVDMNGTVATASYTATVTPAPVDPVKPEEPTKPENPAQPEEPVKPVEPAEPAKPVEPEQEAPQQTVVAPAVEETTQTELPDTGTTDEFAIFNAAALSILASLGLVATSRKKEEQEA